MYSIIKMSRLSYGHAGLRFDAEMANRIAMLRDRRLQEVFDKILLRCLKEIQECCVKQKSTIFEIPRFLTADLQPYEQDEVMEYLTVALRDDRGFRVVKVDEARLYIRWAPLESEEAVSTPKKPKPKRPPTPKQPRAHRSADSRMTLPSRADLADIDALIAKLQS